jgi:hypothetical protein
MAPMAAIIGKLCDIIWKKIIPYHLSTSLLPLMSGGVCMIVFWTTSCAGIPVYLWRICGGLLLLTTLFEGLTFLVFRSKFCGTIFFATYDCVRGFNDSLINQSYTVGLNVR